MMPFGDLLEDYFRESCEPGGIFERRRTIAGRNILFRFTSPAAAEQMTAALAAEEALAAGFRAEYTVFVWDAAQSPRNHVLRAYLYVLANWWFSYTGKRGELVDLHSKDLLTAYLPDLRLMCAVDVPGNRAFYWKSDTTELPYYELCSPFRSLLHGWMRSQGRTFVHGAAVGFPTGGVMLVGKGGSGKSTSALSCLNSPLSYVGDDYCIVSGDPGTGYDVHSLYCTAKLVEEKNLEAFPEIADRVINPVRTGDEKVALSLRELRASKLRSHLPLRAILVPRIVGGDVTSIVPCPASEAVMAIAPSTVSQLPFSGREELQTLAELCRAVPTYRLLLGTRLEQTPIVIADLLATLGVTAPEPAAPEPAEKGALHEHAAQ